MIFARSILVIGLLGLPCSAMLLATSMATSGAQPVYQHVSHRLPETFFVSPKGTVFHSAGCKHVDPSLPNLKVTIAEAERNNFTPCEHCLKRESTQRTASRQSPSPVPTGTAPPPTRDAGR